MITRLPRWVWIWAWVLAFMAGVINVVGYLSFEHQAVTHLTGTTSLLSAAIAQADPTLSVHLLLVIGSFVFGAALSGAIIGDSVLRLGRRYGVVLLLESLALIAAVQFLEQGSAVGTYLAGAACGLQNAMATTYSGTVIRTSHVTGMFTDLGIAVGQLLRGTAVEHRRLSMCLVVISAFLVGGIAGGLAFAAFGYATLNLPATMALLLALGYGAYRTLRRQQSEPDA